ncbi:uncharacterized protein LOC143266403 [Megachile rotundata]|uniref:uncharacterized protein LOC143266403 n=2 Tax=Megachile rotundata TaxID=143995 RepID=UPI003FD09568
MGAADTYALLDEGSTITLIDRKLTRSIGVRGTKVNIALKGLNDRDAVIVSSEKVSVSVRGSSVPYLVKHMTAVPELNLPSQSLPDHVVEHVRKTNLVDLIPYKQARPQLLLGQDNWPLIVTRELQEVKGYDLALSRSLLGWTLHGIVNTHSGADKASVACLKDGEDDSSTEDEGNPVTLDKLIKLYFQLDDFGVRVDTKPKTGHDHALATLKDTSHFIGNAWETGLLWNPNGVPEIDSITTARKRLFMLEKKLDRNPGYAALYYKEMGRFFFNGYAEKVERETQNRRVWYLPHFGVQNVNKPGKLRIVFDAAAKTAGISLYDQLESGPDLLKPLPGVLLRFRQYAVACKADIKDMFLRLKIRKEDRDAQRFLWRGHDRKKEPEIFVMSSLIFGAKSSPTSAIYIKNKNAEDYAHSHPDACRSITMNSYMDDYLVSQKSAQDLIHLVRDVTRINARANFEMHGWASNDTTVVAAAGREPAKDEGELKLCDRGGEKVLGLYWDTKLDELGFKIDMNKVPAEVIRGSRKPTKREYLRVIMSIFDPLGFLVPFTIKSKILMQQIWRSGIGWDDPLRDEENVGWLAWLRTLRLINQSRIPRCLVPTTSDLATAQLHVFCDASLEAYAAVAYIRITTEGSVASVNLIMAKSRVAPLKPLSVPRLELQAALLAARLAKTITEELDIKFHQRFLWSDSVTVLRWIKGEHRMRQVFVAHRLGQIGEISETCEWRWVPSSQNPADIATRWNNRASEEPNVWNLGPEFLRKSESEWPVEKPLDEVKKKTIDEMEMRKAFVYFTESYQLPTFPLALRLLGWQGLLIVARRIQSVISRWKGRTRELPSVTSISTAERYWYRIIQADCFHEEMTAIRCNKELKKTSKIANLRPHIDEHGILRATGRVTKIHEDEFNNFPIILEGKHPATKLLITDYHRRFYHANNAAVVNELHQTYFIIGLRKILRSLVAKCLVCRLQRAKPQAPIMSTLPEGRLAYRQRPFSHCGVDYFGPMFVKIGRRREKRWGVLFTCLTTRAIHLELAHTLSASSAIMALQRLVSRRGLPVTVYSDNGTNFRGASKELKEAIAEIDKEKQREYALTQRIESKFIPPDAPHMGGAWERLIRSVKTALHVVLREQAPTEEVLYTLLTEVEHSVNSRPLTHVPVDPRDHEALTPNHFLIGTSSGSIKLGNYEKQTVCLRKQWKLAQHFADCFWRRWLREYLPSIIGRPKWMREGNTLGRGDLVLIADTQSPRNEWKRGTIIQTYPGSDGVVRVAKIHTSRGDFTRPIHKLIKLLSVREVQNP